MVFTGSSANAMGSADGGGEPTRANRRVADGGRTRVGRFERTPLTS